MADNGTVEVKHFKTMPGCRRRVYFEADELSPRSFDFLFCEGVAAYESARFVEFYKHAQTGLNRCDIFGKFIAIERKPGFEAEGVATTEAAGLYAICHE